MPLLIAGEDRADARQLQRLVGQGKLRRIHPGIYTDDLTQPIETIVRRELYALCAAIAPGAITSHRSAFRARDRAAVDAFHRAGLATGGRDNGAPGPRRDYGSTYYAAFLFDPDGNNIEAVHC